MFVGFANCGRWIMNKQGAVAVQCLWFLKCSVQWRSGAISNTPVLVLFFYGSWRVWMQHGVLLPSTGYCQKHIILYEQAPRSAPSHGCIRASPEQQVWCVVPKCSSFYLPKVVQRRRTKVVTVGVYQNWTMVHWEKMAWSDESCFYFNLRDDPVVFVCVHHLPGGRDSTRMDCGKKPGGGCVMLWAMFCWEPLCVQAFIWMWDVPITETLLHRKYTPSWQQCSLMEVASFNIDAPCHMQKSFRNSLRNTTDRSVCWILHILCRSSRAGFLQTIQHSNTTCAGSVFVCRPTQRLRYWGPKHVLVSIK